MEKFNYYFNTKNRINATLSEPITKANMNSILFNLVWDAYYNISQEEDTIISYVVDWMQSRTTIFHLSAYAKTLRGYIKKMKKMPWRNITDTVKIRKSELDYISSFNDIKKEKILFCYLAIAKFKDMSREYPTHWEDEDDVTVFKMAKVPIPAKKRDYFINDLINCEPQALISLSYKNDDTSKRIDYISDDENDPIVLELDESNYYELAFTYLNWKENGGYKKCLNCGRLFRAKTAKSNNDKSKTNEMNRMQYCRHCSPIYEPEYKGKDDMALDYEPKKIICADCGKEIYLENYMASKTYRCEICQHEANKKAKRDWWNRNKSNNSY
jgi:DNA-directed RNA polymerase subunit RPC12/RpoP